MSQSKESCEVEKDAKNKKPQGIESCEVKKLVK